jgi:uncharacterized protein DUF3306
MSEEEGSKEAFLERWSRRKLDKAEGKPSPPQQAEAQPPAQAKPAAPLPAVETLSPDSDFTPFMASDVAPETRRAALKKLFADAHFNVPDPFEAYSEDYTGGETIPLEMLKRINQATKLLMEEPKTAQAPEPQPENVPQETKDVAGKQDA